MSRENNRYYFVVNIIKTSTPAGLSSHNHSAFVRHVSGGIWATFAGKAEI